MTIDILTGSLLGYYKASYLNYASYGATEKECVNDLKKLLKLRGVK